MRGLRIGVLMGVLQVETRESLKDTEEKNLLRSITGLAAQGCKGCERLRSMCPKDAGLFGFKRRI